MAIKFRCSHCRQLLGISTTKAGMIVDCPACGRSVTVPGEDGLATRPEQKMRPSDHPGLLDALQELTTIGLPDSQPSEPPVSSKPVPRARRPPVMKPASQPSGSNTTTDHDVMRIIPLAGAQAAAARATVPETTLVEPAELSTLEDNAPLIIPEIIEPDAAEEDAEFSSSEQPSDSSPHSQAAVQADDADSTGAAFSPELSSALRELASTVPAKSALALQKPQRSEPQAARRHSLIPMMLILPAFAAGLLLGTFWRSDGTAVTPQPVRESDQKQANILIPPAAGQRQLNGVVLWKDDSGNTSPDAGALILLLTTKNPTRLRLDGRPLRESADSTARKAIEAALQMLGGSVHQADETGVWSANVSAEAELTMIVVSRHRSRSDSQPVPPKILDALNQWFEAPLHVIGRLSVQQKVIPASSNNTDPAATSLDVEFSSQK